MQEVEAEIGFLLHKKMYKVLKRIKKHSNEKYIFALESLIELSMNETPLNRDVLDENDLIDDHVASCFDSFEAEIIRSSAKARAGAKSSQYPANGIQNNIFELPKKILFEQTKQEYKEKLKAIIDKDVEKGISTITFSDFVTRLEDGNYKYDNFLVAYKKFCKNEKPKKPTPEVIEKIKNTSKENIQKAIGMMSVELIKKVTTSEHKEIGTLESNYCEEIETIIKKTSTQLDLNNYDHVQSAYKTLRDTLIEENHIYSMTYKNTGKRETDEETREIHFYSTFWDEFGGKTVTVDGVNLYCDYDEENFFIEGTKKTSEFTTGNIQMKLWEMNK